MLAERLQRRVDLQVDAFDPGRQRGLGRQVGRLRERQRRVLGSDEKRRPDNGAELQADVEEAAVETRQRPQDRWRKICFVGSGNPSQLHRLEHVDQIPANGRRVSCSCVLQLEPGQRRRPPLPPEIATDCRRRSLRRLTTRNAGNFVRTPATRPHRVRDISSCGVELAGRRPGQPGLRSFRGRR
jgi:hypothetical protein